MDGLGKANSCRYSQFQDIFRKEKLTYKMGIDVGIEEGPE